MQTLHFRTDVDCRDCLKHLGFYLSTLPQIQEWEVCLKLPESILTIHSEQLLPKQVIALVREAGFRAELMNN